MAKKLDKRTSTALWLLIGPTALLIITFVLYALVNLISGNGVTETLNALSIAVNIILFIAGLVSILAFIPGIVIGIVLLATRK